MQVKILDDRDGWRERKETIQDINDLNDTWNEVKAFVVPMQDINIVIIMETHNGVGKLNISGNGCGVKSYDLMTMKGIVKVVK